MKLLKRHSSARIMTEEELAEHKKRVADIENEIKRENFDKAVEMAATCVQNYKKNDPYGLAYCNYLMGHCILVKYKKSMPISDFPNMKISSGDYVKAKKSLERSIEIFDILSKNKKWESNRKLMCATALATLADLEASVGHWDNAMEACEKSLAIFKKYGSKDGAELAAQRMFSIQEKQLLSKMKKDIESLTTKNGRNK